MPTVTGKVINGLRVRGKDQVMLKVTVAEVKRNVLKQLGVQLSGNWSVGGSAIGFAGTNPFLVGPDPTSATGYPSASSAARTPTCSAPPIAVLA